MTTWHRCEDCGRFADPTTLTFDEHHRELTMGGWIDTYPTYHTNDEDCVARSHVAAVSTENR